MNCQLLPSPIGDATNDVTIVFMRNKLLEDIPFDRAYSYIYSIVRYTFSFKNFLQGEKKMLSSDSERVKPTYTKKPLRNTQT